MLVENDINFTPKWPAGVLDQTLLSPIVSGYKIARRKRTSQKNGARMRLAPVTFAFIADYVTIRLDETKLHCKNFMFSRYLNKI